MLEQKKVYTEFQEIYEAESNAVFRFCLLRTSDHDLALDLTQDTFMRFWNTLCKEKKIKNCRAFLFAVARNLIIDWYRKKKAVSLESILIEGSEDKNELLASSQQIEVEAEAKYLIRHINALDETYRDAVYLRCVEGLKPKEIASIIGESANVVSVRINRGLRILRETMHYDEK
ncbi:MAG: RNA polymerase sigma factor [Minisyncoccota bacterium]